MQVQDLAGMVPLRNVRAGSPVRVDNLVHPPDVNRGDSVQVEVRLGGTRIGMAGLAESSGRAGESISVRNPASGQIFRARIESRGMVVVEPVLPR